MKTVRTLGFSSNKNFYSRFQRRLLAIKFLAIFVIGMPAFGATATFTILDGLPLAASSDGAVVVGSGNDSNAFRWTAVTGMVSLGGGSPGNYSAVAYSVSANGAVVAGYTGSDRQAFRWTAESGIVGLGFLPSGHTSIARAVSADGAVIVGYSQSASSQGDGEAFRWTAEGGMVGLGDLSGAQFTSIATAVSTDGSVVVGASSSSSGYAWEAFRWTAESGMVGLGAATYNAAGVSTDGSVVIGEMYIVEGGRSVPHAYRYTEAAGIVDLGSNRTPNSISADGTVIVGYDVISGSSRASIWRETQGWRDLNKVMANGYGLDLAGLTLSVALGISADGSTIVGFGNDLSGNPFGWVAQIPVPVPTTPWLFGSALGGLGAIRRRTA